MFQVGTKYCSKSSPERVYLCVHATDAYAVIEDDKRSPFLIWNGSDFQALRVFANLKAGEHFYWQTPRDGGDKPCIKLHFTCLTHKETSYWAYLEGVYCGRVFFASATDPVRSF